MMKERLRRGCALVLAVTTLSLSRRAFSDDPARAVDPAVSLYAATELGLGGQSLYSKLFANGWPTTREYRRLVLDHGEGAFRDGVASYLGSGLGVPLSLTSSARMRAELRKMGPTTLVQDRVRIFARTAGIDIPSRFDPVVVSYRKGDVSFKGSFNEKDPSTWALTQDRSDHHVSLRGLGASMHACALLAELDLSADRKGLDGFIALCALESAVASMHELRTSMMCEKDALTGMPAIGAYVQNPREQPVYVPSLLTCEAKGPRAVYELPKDSSLAKSRLGDQASLLLGLSQLSLALDSSKPTLARFFTDITIDGRKQGALFDKADQVTAAEVALFVFESSRTIHLDINRQRYASVGTPAAAGDSLRPEDVGLYLVGLETFVRALDRIKGAPEHLLGARKRATNFGIELAKILETFQGEATDDGFYEAYSYTGSAATKSTTRRPLSAQGLSVRGLVAAQRIAQGAPGGAVKVSFLDSAAKTLRYLERWRWDSVRRAYVDAPGQKAQKIAADDAASVLGALRDMALTTTDVRYLLRYRDYLTSIRSHGFMRSETSRQGETGENGGDSDKDGVKFAGAAGVAPLPGDILFP